MTLQTVPTDSLSERRHRTLIAILLNQLVDIANGPTPLPSFAVAEVPDAAVFEGHMIYVSDEAGGAVPAFSDGTTWRRVTDRAVIS